MAEDQRLLRPIKDPKAGGPVPPPPRVTNRLLTESLEVIAAENGVPLRKE